MGFWIFMLVMNMLVPVTMIFFGKYFLTRAPREINMVFGYRTNMSMKNKDTWEFAHKYFGRIWFVCGWVLLLLSVILMLFVMGQSEDTIGHAGGIINVVQLVFLMAPIIPTERALKKTFDKNGDRKV